MLAWLMGMFIGLVVGIAGCYVCARRAPHDRRRDVFAAGAPSVGVVIAHGFLALVFSGGSIGVLGTGLVPLILSLVAGALVCVWLTRKMATAAAQDTLTALGIGTAITIAAYSAAMLGSALGLALIAPLIGQGLEIVVAHLLYGSTFGLLVAVPAGPFYGAALRTL